MPEFGKTSLQFHFRNKEGLARDELIFAKKNELMIMNFETSAIRTFYSFAQPLLRQPTYFQTNTAQDVFVISTHEDSIYLNF